MERDLSGNFPGGKGDANLYSQGYFQGQYPQDGNNYDHEYYLYNNQNSLQHTPYALNTQFSAYPVADSRGGNLSAPVQFSKTEPSFNSNLFSSADNFPGSYEMCYQNSGIPNETQLRKEQLPQKFEGETTYSPSQNSGEFFESLENMKDSFPGYGFGKGY
jgi:hypothetical protein